MRSESREVHISNLVTTDLGSALADATDAAIVGDHAYFITETEARRISLGVARIGDYGFQVEKRMPAAEHL